jgi:hypothetical protein
MRRIWLLLAAAIVCYGLQAPVRAQMGMHRPDLSGVFHPVVGAGAVYSVEMQGGAQKSTMEIAVVGKEQVNGKDGYWIEMGFADPRSGGMMYMKSLTVVDGQNMVTSRMIMQMAGQPPMEMSTQMMGMHGNKPQSTDVRGTAERVGTETITTPAGTFSCEHWRQKDGSSDTWISDKVAPWSLVKMVGKNQTMTLLRTITDAKTHITGTPTKFDPMEMMRQHQHQPEQ